MTVNQLKELLNNLPGHEELFDEYYEGIDRIWFEMSENNEGYHFLKMFVRKER